MRRIVAMGEALIDFTPEETGKALKDVAAFGRNAGGAPANVAACAARLGGRSGIVTKLGRDAFGDYLIETLAAAGVDVTHVLRTGEAHTSLAFVSLDANGGREFSFYRDPGADLLLRAEELEAEWFENCILHFCTVDMTDEPLREAHRRAISLAREACSLISFDPNLRFPLWPDAEALRRTAKEFVGYADVVKLGDEETEFVTGRTDPDGAAEVLLKKGVPLVLITRGEKGACAYTQSARAGMPGCNVSAVDTTGAGDAFVGAALQFLAERDLRPGEADRTALEEMLRFAVAVSALTVTRRGAIPSLPSREIVEEFLRQGR